MQRSHSRCQSDDRLLPTTEYLLIIYRKNVHFMVIFNRQKKTLPKEPFSTMDSTCLSDSIQSLLFGFSYCDNCFFTPLTKNEKEFESYGEALLGLIPGCIKEPVSNRTGRKAYALIDILAVWTMKEFFNLKTISATLDFISSNGNLRTITNMENIPSHAVVSRKTRELNDKMDIEGIHSSLCASFLCG